jgi:very-short-patch-repair endonuclease
MNEIEKMYWNGLFQYFETFNYDTFTFQLSHQEKGEQLAVKYSDFDNGEEEYDDETNYYYPASIQASVKSKSVNFDTGFYDSNIMIMFGDCNRWNCKIGNYEPDFIIGIAEEEHLQFVVEIDGFDYHDKTKEQAAKDKQRDRFFLRHGYIPIRFAGTEVYRNAIDCVRETMSIIFETIAVFRKRDSTTVSWSKYQLEKELQEKA